MFLEGGDSERLYRIHAGKRAQLCVSRTELGRALRTLPCSWGVRSPAEPRLSQMASHSIPPDGRSVSFLSKVQRGQTTYPELPSKRMAPSRFPLGSFRLHWPDLSHVPPPASLVASQQMGHSHVSAKPRRHCYVLPSSRGAQATVGPGIPWSLLSSPAAKPLISEPGFVDSSVCEQLFLTASRSPVPPLQSLAAGYI